MLFTHKIKNDMSHALTINMKKTMEKMCLFLRFNFEFIIWSG